MKYLIATMSVLGVLLISSPSDAAEVQIPLDALLAPQEGYDDNDNVEVVIHGNLPNPCYSVGETYAQVDSKKRTIRFKQYANRRTDGICASEETLPPHMQIIVPFNKQHSLGTLPAAKYTMIYQTEEGDEGKRLLNVDHTTIATVDSFSYAIVTGVQTADFFGPNEAVEFTVKGMFNSTCVKFDEEKTKVVKENDVFVVLPITYADENIACAEMLVPFKRTFVVGKAGLGHHLIHVRSLAGQSANHVIEVLPVK